MVMMMNVVVYDDDDDDDDGGGGGGGGGVGVGDDDDDEAIIILIVKTIQYMRCEYAVWNDAGCATLSVFQVIHRPPNTDIKLFIDVLKDVLEKIQ